MSLLRGLAQQLDHDGHGVYRTSDPYTASETGIVFGAVTSTPDRLLTLTLYAGGESDTKLGYDEPNVQVRARGPAGDALFSQELAQDVYDQWHGRGPFDLPNGMQVLNLVGNQSGPIFLGLDDNGRAEHTVNFRVEYRRTTTHRQ